MRVVGLTPLNDDQYPSLCGDQQGTKIDVESELERLASFEEMRNELMVCNPYDCSPVTCSTHRELNQFSSSQGLITGPCEIGKLRDRDLGNCPSQLLSATQYSQAARQAANVKTGDMICCGRSPGSLICSPDIIDKIRKDVQTSHEYHTGKEFSVIGNVTWIHRSAGLNKERGYPVSDPALPLFQSFLPTAEPEHSIAIPDGQVVAQGNGMTDNTLPHGSTAYSNSADVAFSNSPGQDEGHETHSDRWRKDESVPDTTGNEDLATADATDVRPRPQRRNSLPYMIDSRLESGNLSEGLYEMDELERRLLSSGYEDDQTRGTAWEGPLSFLRDTSRRGSV
ncbi:hypothetical protein IAT40_008011 [Kwoniella sp. CBS 6097]